MWNPHDIMSHWWFELEDRWDESPTNSGHVGGWFQSRPQVNKNINAKIHPVRPNLDWRRACKHPRWHLIWLCLGSRVFVNLIIVENTNKSCTFVYIPAYYLPRRKCTQSAPIFIEKRKLFLNVNFSSDSMHHSVAGVADL